MWRCKMSRREMWRCKMCRCKMSRCEMWRCKTSRRKMWRCKMSRRETWRCKMSRRKMWHGGFNPIGGFDPLPAGTDVHTSSWRQKSWKNQLMWSLWLSVSGAQRSNDQLVWVGGPLGVQSTPSDTIISSLVERSDMVKKTLLHWFNSFENLSRFSRTRHPKNITHINLATSHLKLGNALGPIQRCWSRNGKLQRQTWWNRAANCCPIIFIKFIVFIIRIMVILMRKITLQDDNVMVIPWKNLILPYNNRLQQPKKDAKRSARFQDGRWKIPSVPDDGAGPSLVLHMPRWARSPGNLPAMAGVGKGRRSTGLRKSHHPIIEVQLMAWDNLDLLLDPYTKLPDATSQVGKPEPSNVPLSWNGGNYIQFMAIA